MVGPDILCKFLVNNVIAYHLWTITSPLIAQGGTWHRGISCPWFLSTKIPFFQIQSWSLLVTTCERRMTSRRHPELVTQVLDVILLFVCNRTITYLLCIGVFRKVKKGQGCKPLLFYPRQVCEFQNHQLPLPYRTQIVLVPFQFGETASSPLNLKG